MPVAATATATVVAAAMFASAAATVLTAAMRLATTGTTSRRRRVRLRRAMRSTALRMLGARGMRCVYLMHGRLALSAAMRRSGGRRCVARIDDTRA